MAKTPYVDLSTQDILSAHISGLAHSINKIEDVLNMKTSQATFTLNPVADQEEIALRYRIYEGQHRNWITFALRRNGQSVNSDEYIAQPEFGVVVFHTPQAQTDVVEVTATFITNGSNKIDEIDSSISNVQTEISSVNSDVSSLQTELSGVQSNISSLQSSVSSLESNVSSLETEVQNLKDNSGGGGEGYPPGGIYIPIRQPSRSIFTNIRPDKTISDLTNPSTNILMAAGKADAIPVIIDHRTKITRLQMYGGTGTAGGNVIMGIYGDSATQPSDLIAQTDVFTMGSGNIVRNLIEPVWLTPGLYWLVRWGENGIRLDGYAYQPGVHIEFEPVPSNLMDGTGPIIGVRSPVMSGLTSLPTEFPAVGANSNDSKYLSREYIGTVYALR
ncbi:adhesin [Geobacillus phage GR1]|nr:adhesin [Geobacillus phage GR1]